MVNAGAPILSLIIPAHNEGDRLSATLKETLDYLALQPYKSEVIVVDDGSTDDTPLIMARFAEQSLRVRTISYAHRRGKGYAVRSGMRAALGKYLVFMDADLSYPLHHLEDMLSVFDRGHQVVIGSRALPESRARISTPLSRRLASRGFNLLIHMLGLSSFEDTQCGFKGFTREAAEKLFSRQRVMGFAFDAELLFVANKLDLSVYEIPVSLNKSSRSSVRFVRDGYRIVRDLVATAYRGWRGVYGTPARRQGEHPFEEAHAYKILDKRGDPH